MKNVLYVEDLPIALKVIKIIFEAEFPSYSIQIAKNSPEMITFLKEKNYDFVIIDLQIAENELVQLVKKTNSLYPKIKMLVFTSNSKENYIHSLYEAGVDYHLKNQADDDEILKTIRSFLNHTRHP